MDDDEIIEYVLCLLDCACNVKTKSALDRAVSFKDLYKVFQTSIKRIYNSYWICFFDLSLGKPYSK